MLVGRVWQLVRRHALACCALTHHPYSILCSAGVAAAAAAGAATGATGAGGPRLAFTAGSCYVGSVAWRLGVLLHVLCALHFVCAPPCLCTRQPI